MKQVYFIRSAHIARNAADFIVRLPICDDRPMCVEIKETTRNLEQNARFHAMLADISRQTTYAGRKLTPQQWKILFISGHAIATGEGADMIPGLENEFVNIRESSAQMSVKRMASLIEYVSAWAADKGVKFNVSE